MRSVIIAVIGRPNVGKSTLLNRLIGEKLSIVSRRPQTTWQRLNVIVTTEDAQFVFIDTPGLDHSRTSDFISLLSRLSISAMGDAHVLMHIVEPRVDERETSMIKEIGKFKNKTKLLLINKIDLLKNKQLLLPVINRYAGMKIYNDILPVSAKIGDGMDELLSVLKKYTTVDGLLYTEDTITDKYEKELVAEIVREKLFLLTGEEIPYASACTVEKFDESERDKIIRIHAMIYVEKNSQKGIVIGNKGSMIKRIGTAARLDLEQLLGTKVYLELYVKVKPGWKKDQLFLEEIGLK